MRKAKSKVKAVDPKTDLFETLKYAELALISAWPGSRSAVARQRVAAARKRFDPDYDKEHKREIEEFGVYVFGAQEHKQTRQRTVEKLVHRFAPEFVHDTRESLSGAVAELDPVKVSKLRRALAAAYEKGFAAKYGKIM